MVSTPCCSKNICKGFTLIELLVSVSIMAIILGITLSGGPQAIMRLTLADNTYKTEILLREVQLQGSAINSLDGAYGGAGLFFNRASSTQTLKFRDRVVNSISNPIGIGNGLYNASPIDEKDSITYTTNNHRIGKLCVTTGTSTFVCNDTPNPAINTLTISFSRPSQTAHIYVNGTSTTDYSAACIQFDSLRSPSPGYVRALYVYKSGMITKTTGTCN